MKENKYDIARENMNKSEEIREYIEKLDDIIGLVDIPGDDNKNTEKTLDSVKDINIQNEVTSKVKSKEEINKNKSDKEQVTNKVEAQEEEINKKGIN